MAVVYADAVHRVDENGVWQDIDNRLYDNGSDYASSDARVKFAKKITGNAEIFTLHEGNQKISLALEGAWKKTEGEIIASASSDENGTALQKLMNLEGLSAGIRYANILEGTDLEYHIVSNNIKEYIVVTFLAVLEMARKQELLITQDNNFDKITCEVV